MRAVIPRRAPRPACATPPPVVGRWTVVPAEPCGPVDGIVAPDPGSADPERCTRKTPRSQGAMLETFPPGRRVEIIDDCPLAIVGEAGGGIRCHEVGGRSVFDPYPVHTLCDGAQGSAHPLAQPPDRRTVPLQRQTPAAHQHRTGRWHHPRISRVTPPRGDDTGLRLHRPLSGRTRPGPGPPRADRSTSGRRLGGGWLPGHGALRRRPWPHLVIAQETHSGWCADRHGPRLVRHHSGLDWVRGKARGHCPGAAHLVVGRTCSPPRKATSADQLVLVMVDQ